MCQLLINFTYEWYDTISLKMSNYNFVHICVKHLKWLKNILDLVYMFWMDFSQKKSEFSWGFVFLNSLSMFALLCSAHIFYKLQKLLSASSQIKWAPTAWLIKILRLNDSFIQANMDADFPATQTSFSHKMKTTKDILINGTLILKSSCLYPKYSN